MRKIILFVLLLTSAIIADDFKIEITPEALFIGENATLKVIATSGDKAPQITEFPKISGFQWVGTAATRSSTQNIYGHISQQIITSYIFKLSTKEVTIPKLKIKQGSKVGFVGPIKITAVKRSFQGRNANGQLQTQEIDDMIFAKVISSKNTFYLGENIPIEIHSSFQEGVNARPTYPEIETDKFVFQDYSEINPQNPKFDKPNQISKIKDGVRFSVIVFKTSLQALSEGDFEIKPNLECEIRIKNQSNSRRRGLFDDDFFGFSSRYKKVSHTMKTETLSLNIKPLPKSIKNEHFIGLVGDWELNHKLKSDKFTKGEPISLDITIVGKGNLNALTAPNLNIENFRVYPPEIKKKKIANFAESATIKYILIPKKIGVFNIDIPLSTFSVKSKKYQTYKINEKVTIEQGDNISNSLTINNSNQENSTQKNIISKRKKHPSDILYLKRDLGTNIQIPLLKNKSYLILFFVILGITIIVVSEIIYLKFLKMTNNPNLLRKKLALKSKNKMMKKLKLASDEDVITVIQDDVISFLNDVTGTPPGTTAGALADAIKDEEISQNLKTVESYHFMPSDKNMTGIKESMIKYISKISIFILVSFLTFANYADFNNQINYENAFKEYNDGNFAESAKLYEKLLTQQPNNPNILYNLANTYYQENKSTKALILYEYARRLNPRDSDIIENINYIRRKLLLPEILQTETPYQVLIYCRDSLRPDEWLLIASIAFFSLCIIIASRRKILHRNILMLILITLFIILMSIIAPITQYNSTYSNKKGMIIEESSLFSLPSGTNGQVIQYLKKGEEVEIKETVNKWYRISGYNFDGWIKKTNMLQFFK